MREATLTLKDGTVLTIRNSNRIKLLFEEYRFKDLSEMNGKATDSIWWLYCTLKGCNRTVFLYDFDDFIDVLDENPHIWDTFNSFWIEENKPVKPEPEEKKKVKD